MYFQVVLYAHDCSCSTLVNTPVSSLVEYMYIIMCYETGYYETLLLEEILQDLSTDSDCDNSQSNKDEICDNSQSDKDDNSPI